MTSPQPQPIDDIAGMRAVPWDDSAPRAVQVVFRHDALDLMPLLHAEIVRNDGATPRSQIKTLKGIGSDVECDSRQSDGTSRTTIG